MSFSSVNNKKQYNTDGIVDTFSFPYPFQQTSDLVVQLKDNTTLVVTTLVENTDYTVTPVGDAGRYTSGSVVTTVTYPAGSTLTILRIVANDQQTANYNPGGDFDEQSTEDAFDKASMQAQQTYNGAVILKKSGDVDGPLELPDLADNAGKGLQINSAGTGITASDSTATSDARVNSLFNGAAADDIFTTFINLLNGALIIDGTGTPEGAVVAPVGSIFLRTDGGAGTSIYFKETGAGNTGWVARNAFDTINEATVAGGVNIDSCLIKDGGVEAVTDQGGGNNIKCKVVDIGVWNMVTTANVAIAHGLTLANIVSANGVIIADSLAEHFPVSVFSSSIHVESDVGFLSIGATNISLVRKTGGFFDSANFDDAVMNRGYINIWYKE
jgi:hypothetical protein